MRTHRLRSPLLRQHFCCASAHPLSIFVAPPGGLRRAFAAVPSLSISFHTECVLLPSPPRGYRAAVTWPAQRDRSDLRPSPCQSRRECVESGLESGNVLRDCLSACAVTCLCFCRHALPHSSHPSIHTHALAPWLGLLPAEIAPSSKSQRRHLHKSWRLIPAATTTRRPAGASISCTTHHSETRVARSRQLCALLQAEPAHLHRTC